MNSGSSIPTTGIASPSKKREISLEANEVKSLSEANKLVILYGLSGSGKSHLGEILKKHFGFYFWDGDNALTDKMLECIKQKKSFDQEMRDEFTNILIERIKYLKTIVNEKPIVISQALYKSSNRQTLMAAFEDAQFIHVNVSDEVLLERSNKRGGIGTDLAKKIRSNFEEPVDSEQKRTLSITNNSENEALTISTLETALNLQEIKQVEKPPVVGSPIEILLDTSMSDDFQRSISTQSSHFPFIKLTNKDSKDSTSDKKDENPFRVYVEQNDEYLPPYSSDNKAVVLDEKLSTWLIHNIQLQEFDLKILICKNKAYFHSRSNKVKEINFENSSIAAKYIISSSVNNRFKIDLRNKEVIALRGRTKIINQIYHKFFNVSLKYFKETSRITSSTHLIKTFDENRHFLSGATYTTGQLFKQYSSTKPPTIIFFPGTAYTRMIGETVEKESYKIAATTGCNVFTVHYRLSPENVYPTPLLDAFTTHKFLTKNADNLGISNNFIFFGYSSGADIALQFGYLVTINNITPKPSSLALICPTVDFSYLMPGYDKAIGSSDRFLKIDFFRSMHTPYLSQFKNLKNPALSPLYMDEKSLTSLPKVFMFHTKKDVFTEQHESFSKKLDSHGGSPEVVSFSELDHCSWWDNQLQWEALANWIRKNYDVKNSTLSKKMVLSNQQFFKNEIFSFKITSSILFSPMEQPLKDIIDQVYINLLLKRDASSVLELADQYPENVPLQTYAAMYHAAFQANANSSSGVRYIDRLSALKSTACEREGILIEALLLVKNNLIDKAIEKYTEVLSKWPEDMLAGLMIEFHCSQIGAPDKLFKAWDSIKEKYIKDHRIIDSPLTCFFLSKYGYALGGSNQPEKALHYAGQALSLNPFNPHAQLAVADAYLKLNDVEPAISTLRRYKSLWSLHGDEVKTENYFHLAISYLQKNDFKNAYKIYEKYIRKTSPTNKYQQIDMITLLWRFDLLENIPTSYQVKIRDEWNNLHRYLVKDNISHLRILDKSSTPFMHLISLYLCLSVDDNDTAELITNRILAREDKAWQTAGQVAKGLTCYFNGEYGTARKHIKDVFAQGIIGGSQVHRSVIIETYLTICKKHDLRLKSQEKSRQILKYGVIVGCTAGLFYNVFRIITASAPSKKPAPHT